MQNRPQHTAQEPQTHQKFESLKIKNSRDDKLRFEIDELNAKRAEIVRIYFGGHGKYVAFFTEGLSDLVFDAQPPVTKYIVAPRDNKIYVCVKTPRNESACRVNSSTKTPDLAKPILLGFVQHINGPPVPGHAFQNNGPISERQHVPLVCGWRHSKILSC